MAYKPWGVSGLVVEFGHKRAVDNVSFSLWPGRITALVGGDGAGKTSTLQCLVGAIAPTGGHVTTAPADEIGYVSAGPGVYRDLTVEENLQFAGRSYGVPPEVLERRINDLLERTALEAAGQRLAGKLSGGMRQKLALAMAILHEPNLLVLDEPTTGVDPVSRAELWRLIAAEAAAGAAIAIATSYLDEAARAEHVVVMVEGSVLMAGSPEELVASVEGGLFDLRHRPEVWRRGRDWRLWAPDPDELAAGRAPEPDLEDVVVIAELVRQRAENSVGVSP